MKFKPADLPHEKVAGSSLTNRKDMKIFREITPVKKSDVFVILDSYNVHFDYPIHNHPEYELNLVIGSSGNRIVGDSIEGYAKKDLVLLGPYLYHKWDRTDIRPDGVGPDCRVVTIQFDEHLFDSTLLSKGPFYRIRKLLNRSNRGIRFTGKTFERAQELITGLTRLQGFESVLVFMQLLELLANSTECRFLASEVFREYALDLDNHRMEIAYQYVVRNFTNPELKIGEVAEKLHMAESTFSHFFKKNTNKSFTNFLLDMRLGYACKQLLESDDNVGNISLKSGFNNLANFNRLFRKYRRCTPLQYRKQYKMRVDFDWSHQLTPYQFVPEDNGSHPLLKPEDYATKLAHN